MLSKHSRGSKQGNDFAHNSPGNVRPQSSLLTEPLWTDLWNNWVKLKRNSWFTFRKKKKWRKRGKFRPTSPYIPRIRRIIKPPPPREMKLKNVDALFFSQRVSDGYWNTAGYGTTDPTRVYFEAKRKKESTKWNCGGWSLHTTRLRMKVELRISISSVSWICLLSFFCLFSVFLHCFSLFDWLLYAPWGQLRRDALRPPYYHYYCYYYYYYLRM